MAISVEPLGPAYRIEVARFYPNEGDRELEKPFDASAVIRWITPTHVSIELLSGRLITREYREEIRQYLIKAGALTCKIRRHRRDLILSAK